MVKLDDPCLDQSSLLSKVNVENNTRFTKEKKEKEFHYKSEQQELQVKSKIGVYCS